MATIWDDPPPKRHRLWPLVIGWLVLVTAGIGIAWLALHGVADLARPL